MMLPVKSLIFFDMYDKEDFDEDYDGKKEDTTDEEAENTQDSE